jgi:cobalt-precorrin-5B (C1)-methyltransferase
MIASSVQEVCREFGWEGGMDVLISIPKGEEVAARTFNPRLGIVGGISVLGTSGIVMPMSETALVDSLRAEMRMLHANGGEYLVITPGNYGETFSREMGSLDLTYEMKCSNFVGETMDMAEALGVKGILFIAHIGKFVKVSGGIMNTHSHNADSRAELTAAAAVRSGADLSLVRRILETNTTEDALDILEEGGPELFARAMQDICDRAVFYLQARCRGSVETELVMFSSVKGKLAQSSGAEKMIRRINDQGRGMDIPDPSPEQR